MKSRRTTRAAVTMCVAILILAAACGDDSTPAADSDRTQSATESTRVEPAKVPVPDVAGLPIGQAIERLRATGLRIGAIMKRPSARSKGIVLVQKTRTGTRLGRGSSVSLVIAVPLPIVPDTVGADRFAAQRELRHAGFNVVKTRHKTSSARPGTVVDQTPRGGTRARPGATVTITIATKPPAPPPSTQEDNCTSGYSPCLPPASDYDCAGGSGDGPAYANGPIYVTGSDPYELDSDSDGVACE
jgi:resuscitation-promoting factor RpfB